MSGGPAWRARRFATRARPLADRRWPKQHRAKREGLPGTCAHQPRDVVGVAALRVSFEIRVGFRARTRIYALLQQRRFLRTLSVRARVSTWNRELRFGPLCVWTSNDRNEAGHGQSSRSRQMTPYRTRGIVYSIPPWSTSRQLSQSPPSPGSYGGGRAR